MKMKKHHIAISVLIIIYCVGLVGTLFFDAAIMKLTPINLLISAAILFWFHSSNNTFFIIYCFVVFISGYLIELAGVQTGRLFGDYSYGNNLGVKLLNVPVIIGLNWLILSYCSSIVSNKLLSFSSVLNNKIGKVLLATFLMLLVDIFIEQVASTYQLWYWKNGIIPVQNYTAWFAFSFAFNFLFFSLHVNTDNKMASAVYVLQLLFFIGLTLFHFYTMYSVGTSDLSFRFINFYSLMLL
jgi:putative membrane protein